MTKMATVSVRKQYYDQLVRLGKEPGEVISNLLDLFLSAPEEELDSETTLRAILHRVGVDR